MNNLDIALVVVLIIGFAYGYIKGLIKQLSFGAGILTGLLLAVLYNPLVSQWIINKTQWSSWVATPVAFIGILVCIVILTKVTGIVLSAMIDAIHLGFIDKILGAMLSSVVALLLSVGAVMISSEIAPDNKLTGKTSQNESLLYYKVKGFTDTVVDEAKEKIDEKK